MPVWDARRFGERGGKSYNSLASTRDLEEHAKLRRPWNKAFSAAPVKGYEALIVKRLRELVQGLENACHGSPEGVGRVDLVKWISHFAFDFMGDLAYAPVNALCLLQRLILHDFQVRRRFQHIEGGRFFWIHPGDI